MSTYLVTIPVGFEEEPDSNFISDLSEALGKYASASSTFAPQVGQFEFYRRGTDGIHTFNLLVQADDQGGAVHEGRKVLNSALLDIGRTVETARVDTRTLHAEPWNAATGD
ncbi:hypothetical protein [Streptomyces sp. WAC08241]|uniref:hypothetical protein n=1 Tax=Streptomyces sp. WAC08241 TaxID=2487421 RepID=UPI000F78A960|nr:hypothetical protein [Streptomyces sp. WAC08241]RSS47094.1 hypothetical protein EF906_00140 [Streptomyces sp. WAC08241]